MKKSAIILAAVLLVALTLNLIEIPMKILNSPTFKLFSGPISQIGLGKDNFAPPTVRDNGAAPESEIYTADLVVLTRLDNSFMIDLKYATTDNFTGKKIYSRPLCLIHRNTAQKLIRANNEFKKMGYRIKIYDAYRPYSAQRVLYDAAPNKTFLADPAKGSHHNRGAAVDITLVDQEGKELPMPSAFDEFNWKSRINYYGGTREQTQNRELLGSVMVKCGFKRIGSEWWHFEDTDAKDYPLLNIPFEAF